MFNLYNSILPFSNSNYTIKSSIFLLNILYHTYFIFAIRFILQFYNILFFLIALYNIGVGGAYIMGFKVKPQVSKAEPSLNKTLRLKETMINEIQALADKKDVSFNYLVSQMLQYCLDNLDED